jgi:hypothetical protein
METVEISGRSDFALWAIQRAQEIVRTEGSALALAARDTNEASLQENGAALGKRDLRRPARSLRRPDDGITFEMHICLLSALLKV